MTTDNDEGDEEPSELSKQLEEAQVLFPTGRIVQLKSGGPKMTVQRCYIFEDGEDDGVMVDCIWFPSSTNSVGVVPIVEYGRDVQQFDFPPDALIAAV